MGYLKGKSSMMIFNKHANLKYKFGNKHFWSTGYYVSTVSKYSGAALVKALQDQGFVAVGNISM
jgi:putative transposase